MANLNLVDLPDDVLRIILAFVDWRDVLNVKQTHSRFCALADENSLWKSFCYSVFRFWAPRPFMPRGVLPPQTQRSTYSEWKSLFQERYLGDRQTRVDLNSIISKSISPEEGLERIGQLGNDGKDALKEMGDHAAKYPDELARRYWAYTCLGYLHRVLAVEQWVELRHRGVEEGELDCLERFLGAFDLFIPDIAMHHDLNDFSARLDEYTRMIQEAHSDFQDQTPRQMAVTVAEWLRSHKLIGIRPDQEYHLLAHNFIGKALFGPTNDSLPIVSAIIFCGVMRRLGVRAYPLGLPFHVFAIVQPMAGQDLDGLTLDNSESTAESMYMDPFRSSELVSASTLRELTRTLGLSQDEAESLALDPTPIIELVARCAVNILNSLRASLHNPAYLLCEMDANAAHYAALWASQIARRQSRWQRLDILVELYTQYFPYDGGLFDKYCDPPSPTVSPERRILDRATRKVTPKPVVKRRYPNAEERQRALLAIQETREGDTSFHRHHPPLMVANPEYFVGQVFRHKRYDYTAVITGWDPCCMAGSGWISRMGVNRMDGGSGQPFYHAFVKEDNSTRYVGEENIVPLPTNEVFPEQFSIMIGKWFKNWDRDLGRFASNVKDEYPDD